MNHTGSNDLIFVQKKMSVDEPVTSNEEQVLQVLRGRGGVTLKPGMKELGSDG